MAWTRKATEEAPLRFVPAGDYPMRVEKAEYKISSGGNDMIQIELRVLTPGGPLIRDWLMDAEQCPDLAWRTDSFALATGLAAHKGAEYTIDPNNAGALVGLTFNATLGTKNESYVDKHQVQQTVTKNTIARYIPAGEKGTASPAAPPAQQQPAAKRDFPNPTGTEVPSGDSQIPF